MKIYSPPAEVGNPNISYNEDWPVQEKQYINKLYQYVVKYGQGKSRGKIVRYQVADGYAEYMVFSEKPAALIHIPLADAYQYPMVSRFTMKEVLSDIQRQEEFHKLFQQA